MELLCCFFTKQILTFEKEMDDFKHRSWSGTFLEWYNYDKIDLRKYYRGQVPRSTIPSIQ